MKLYRHAGNIKSALFMMGIILVIGLLTYTQILVNQLRRDNRSIVRLYAGMIAIIVQDENDNNLDYIFENIIQKVKFPLIQTDTDDNPQMWKNLPEKIVNEEDYPDYYLQNFHHQTDGYLSDHSAEIYDLQVEILFSGTADSMRRRVLSPLKKGLKNFLSEGSKKVKVLDIATGTGRTLQQIKSALPQVELYGLDLSGSYLKQASKYLSSRSGDLVQLTKGNAEKMPFASASFQALTCVFLFHELPRDARQNVLNECFRLLEPGGTLVLADSIQIEDSPKFTPIMENFHKIFHEPYYRDYIVDNINLRLEESGFASITSESHFMTKVWKAYKPV